jgi:hypothetical protein
VNGWGNFRYNPASAREQDGSKIPAKEIDSSKSSHFK